MTGGLPGLCPYLVWLLWPTGDQGWGGQLASLWSGRPPKASSHSAPGPPPAEPLATPGHCPAIPTPGGCSAQSLLLEGIPMGGLSLGQPLGISDCSAPTAPPPHPRTPPLLQSCFRAAAW